MPSTAEKRKLALTISRIAIGAFILLLASAIIRREPREMLLGVIVALVPIIFGPWPYRIVGIFAAVGAFLATALIQLS